jgi:hypothetical protein
MTIASNIKENRQIILKVGILKAGIYAQIKPKLEHHISNCRCVAPLISFFLVIEKATKTQSSYLPLASAGLGKRESPHLFPPQKKRRRYLSLFLFFYFYFYFIYFIYLLLLFFNVFYCFCCCLARGFSTPHL